jgi:ferredoxin
MTYRIEIDRSLCSGFGACAELAPDVFEVAPDGIASIRADTSVEPSVLEAADACPMGAIFVVEVVEEAA